MATSIQEYSPTEAALADLAGRYKGVLFEVQTPAGLATAKKARAELRTYRVALEKLRVEIKAPALKRVQEVDSEARRITAALVALEDPIDAQIKKEEERKELERTAAARAEADRLAAEAESKRIVEEAKLAAERADIARRQAALDAAEKERLETEAAARRKIEEEERAARQRIEDQERAARVAREEADRVAAVARAAEEALLRVARDKVEAERAEVLRQERLAQQARDEVARLKAREIAEAQDARSMLETFVKRFGHRVEFKPLVDWINKYLSQGRKAA